MIFHPRLTQPQLVQVQRPRAQAHIILERSAILHRREGQSKKSPASRSLSSIETEGVLILCSTEAPSCNWREKAHAHVSDARAGYHHIYPDSLTPPPGYFPPVTARP